MPDECKNESTADRRDFLKLVGVAGAAISSLSLSEATSDGRCVAIRGGREYRYPKTAVTPGLLEWAKLSLGL